jgi:pantoate--beta-alanine ligase
MRTIRTVAELREHLRLARRAERGIGLVATMGALHDGHLSLARRARQECEVVVMSLFVNPTQFNDSGDLAAYPRDEATDAELAAAAGVDILFAPAAEEVYPPGFATTVSVAGVTEVLEGRERGRGHFDGVATVVCKLLNMVGPDIAYFGQKDAQQVAVIRRLVRDLDIPVSIAVCPTIREPDGLALSSRNVRLSASQRAVAPVLHRALRAIQSAAARPGATPAQALDDGRRALAQAGITPEYLTLCDPDSLRPVTGLDRPALALIAARLGDVRLIDNLLIEPAVGPTHPPRGGDPVLGRQPA